MKKNTKKTGSNDELLEIAKRYGMAYIQKTNQLTHAFEIDVRNVETGVLRKAVFIGNEDGYGKFVAGDPVEYTIMEMKKRFVN